LGGLTSALAATSPLSFVREQEPELQRFEDGQILTTNQLNALIDRIHKLENR